MRWTRFSGVTQAGQQMKIYTLNSSTNSYPRQYNGGLPRCCQTKIVELGRKTQNWRRREFRPTLKAISIFYNGTRDKKISFRSLATRNWEIYKIYEINRQYLIGDSFESFVEDWKLHDPKLDRC